jgi:hypothetical protein
MSDYDASFDSPDKHGMVGDARGVVPHIRDVRDIVQLLLGKVEAVEGYPVSLRVIEPIVEIATLTPANVEIADIFNILYDGAIFATYTALAATVADVTAGLAAAWTAATAAWAIANPASAGKGPDRIAAADGTTVLTLTFDTAGIPFAQRVTATAVDGGGADTQTLVLAVTQNNDTSFIDTDPRHILGTSSLKFSKIDGTNNKVNAGVQRSDLGLDRSDRGLDLSRFGAYGEVDTFFLLSSKVNVIGVHMLLGTDESNHNHWDLLNAAITAAVWQEHEKTIAETEPTVVGNGWDPSDVRYAAFYVEWDLATRTLADVLLDSASMHN